MNNREFLITIIIVALLSGMALSYPSLDIDSWVWVKGRASASQITDYDADMFVLNPRYYSQDEVEEMQEGGKIILAYVLVGEADKNLDYWMDIRLQHWVLGASAYNSNHIIIEFWDDQGMWRSHIKDHIEDLLDSGYDGVFLDSGRALINFSEHSKEYFKLVEDICKEIDEFYDDRYIVLLNSGAIFDQGELPNLIDGLVEEGIWWNEEHHATSDSLSYTKKQYLLKAQGYGITTMCVEYPDLPADVMSIEINAESNDILPCILPW